MRIGFFEIKAHIPKIFKEKQGNVYILFDKYFKRYKIGYTYGTVVDRCKQIASASGSEYEIVYYFKGWRKNEKYLHRQLEKYKLKGEFYAHDEYVKNMFHCFAHGVLTGADASKNYGVQYV